MSSLNRYQSILKQWGLLRIPFTSVPPEDPDILARIFHGREREIDQILPALYEGRNVMIRGAWGIGKTALIYKALDQLGTEVSAFDEQLLIIYIAGIPTLTAQDFYRTLLTAVAGRLAEQDEIAQAILEKLTGLYTQKARTTLEGKVNLTFVTFGAKQETVDHQMKADSIGDPYQLLINLLDRAEDLYTGLVVAVDDLDKQDVSLLQEILEGSLSLFRMGQRRAFLLTGRGFTELQDATLRALAYQANGISEDITNAQLDQVGALTFVQLLPELRLLEEQELLLRTEDSQGFRFVPSKLVLPPPDPDSVS